MSIAAMPQAQALRWIGLLIVALLLLTGVQRLVGTEPASASVGSRPVWSPPDYAETRAMLDRSVSVARARLAADPDAWSQHEALAMALHARGQLDGSHEDLVEAMENADAARALAPETSGPVLSRAIVALSLHRNDVAASEVARIDRFAVPAPDADRAEGEAIEGDVALYSGNYRDALRQYVAAETLKPGLGTTVRLADWHRHQGQFAAARGILERGLDDPAVTAWARAALLLQLGAIDLQTGKWQAAERRFAEADAAFPGWWLAQAHLGQMAATRGDYSAAARLYEQALVGAERPSVMEALAAVRREQGREAEAERLEREAARLWHAWVADQPAAYADHAFEAAYRHGEDARAWQLAALNYRSRPYGDGRIGLARAAARRGRDASARAILEELEGTGWRSTEQYRVLTDVCERLGDAQCAARARRAALAISPLAFDERAGLLFFGNH